MHFSSYNNFGNPHEAFKLTRTGEDQQQQQHHHPVDTTADFFSFADASSDFNHVDPASMGTANYDSHSHALEAAYQMLPFHAVSDPLANHTPLLSGHDPDYLISPMLQSTSHIGTTTSGLAKDEEAMYPLMLPANDSPFLHHEHSRGSTGSAAAAMADEHLVISPLTSPALHSVSTSHQHHQQNIGIEAQAQFESHYSSTNNNTPKDLQQELALIERQQEQLRNAHRYFHGHQQLSSSPSVQPTSSHINATSRNSRTTPSTPSNTQNSPYLNPATASSSRSLLPRRQQNHCSSSPTVTSPSATAAGTTRTTNTTVKAPAVAANGKSIAPATPSLLMKLGQRDSSTSTTSITYTNNMASATPSAAVDNMGSLPAAMLEIKPPTATKKTAPSQPKRRRTSRASGAFTSPGLVPMISPHFSSSDPTVSVLLSPAALRPQMAMSSPRALKPLISPSLKPNGKRLNAYEEEAAAVALASKSNYQNMREGKAKSLGIDFSSTFQSGVENRRSAHKVAEQKRRDTLKQSFDSLRKEISEALLVGEQGSGSDGSSSSSSSSSNGGGDQPTATAETTRTDQGRRDVKEKEAKQMSKVELIQHSYEYILKLKEANRRKDQEMERLRHQIQALNQQLNGNNKDNNNEETPQT